MLERGWSIEAAAPQDADSIARLVRASLPVALRRLTIWSSPRAGRYVHAILCGAFPRERHQFYLLRRGSTPAGLAAFRLFAGAAFLNHLYIAPRCRGSSLGSLLLEAAARRYLVRHPAREIGLDVFAGNRRATAWYRRLGFEQRARLGWWILARGVHAATTRAPAAVAPAAARQHRAWGFSQFAAETRAGRYQVGRLCAPFFRLTDPRAAADPDLLAALARLNPRRRVLLIAPASSASPGLSAGWKQVAQSRRLRARSAVLLSRLASARRARGVTEPEILELENLEREKVRHLL
jgi:ribosomal protein S18 acetylase RimI-like enzyme